MNKDATGILQTNKVNHMGGKRRKKKELKKKKKSETCLMKRMKGWGHFYRFKVGKKNLRNRMAFFGGKVCHGGIKGRWGRKKEKKKKQTKSHIS